MNRSRYLLEPDEKYKKEHYDKGKIGGFMKTRSL